MKLQEIINAATSGPWVETWYSDGDNVRVVRTVQGREAETVVSFYGDVAARQGGARPMTEIKSCPFCGSTDTEVRGAFWVKCFSCMAYGPTKDSPDEAINAWNGAIRKPELADGWVQNNSVIYNTEAQPIPQLVFEGLPDGATVRIEHVSGGPITIAIGVPK